MRRNRRIGNMIFVAVVLVFALLALAGCASEYLVYKAVPVETSAEALPGESGPETCFVVQQETNRGTHSLGVYCKVDPAR